MDLIGFDECIEDSGSGVLNLLNFTCLEGFGRLILMCFTCLEGLWGAPDSGNLRGQVGRLNMHLMLILRARV